MPDPQTHSPILKDFPDSFETERLLIRSPMPGDGPEFNAAKLESADELRRWMEWAREKPTVRRSEEDVRRARAAFLERSDLMLLLFSKGTDTLVGSSGLHRIDWRMPKFEIGYWCRTQFVGQGYITEAAQVENGHRASCFFPVMEGQRIEETNGSAPHQDAARRRAEILIE